MPNHSNSSDSTGKDIGKSAMSQCPVCGANYDSANRRVIEDSDLAQVAHLICKNCQQSFLVCTVESPVGVSSVGTLTDLTAEDATKFHNKTSLSEDDVLSLHSILEREKNSFSHLFYSR